MSRVTEYSKTCEFCGETFHSPQHYSAHKRRQHPGWRNGTVISREAVPEEVAAYVPERAAGQSHECESCQRTFATRQSLGAHARWCKNQYEQEPHSLGDDSGPAPVEDLVTGFFCCYCGTDLSHVLQAMVPTFCPRCGKDIHKILDLLTFSVGE